MNVHRRRRRRYLGIDLILDTGGVFGSLPPLALPRVIGGDAGVVVPPAPPPAPPPPPSGESNSPPSPNTSLRRVAAGVIVAGSAAGFAGKTRDRVGLFFLGAAGGSGRSSRPGRVGWLIGGVADIVSSSARNQPGRNLLQLARSLATDKANFHLGLVSRLGGNARGGRMVRRGILAANGG